MDYQLRKATLAEIPSIWDILQKAILRRKQDGSEQWQDGYPNQAVIREDIEKGAGYVLTDKNGTIIGYSAIIINDEPTYEHINGAWLTNDDFLVVHRIAIGEQYLGKGLAGTILGLVEKIALEKGIFSIKVDTNFDNTAMLKTLGKAGYIYCGEIMIRESGRKAFEKTLRK